MAKMVDGKLFLDADDYKRAFASMALAREVRQAKNELVESIVWNRSWYSMKAVERLIEMREVVDYAQREWLQDLANRCADKAAHYNELLEWAKVWLFKGDYSAS